MSGEVRCPQCGGFPPEGHRLTVPRAKTGDLVFCGYHCFERWDATRREPAATSGAVIDRQPAASAQASVASVAEIVPTATPEARLTPYPGPRIGSPDLRPAGANRCRSCAEPIVWGETEAGKRAPFNASDGQNHFVTCPQRREWRKAEKPIQSSLFGDGDVVAPEPSALRPWDA